MLQQQQEVEETPIPTHSQAGGHRLDRQSPLLPDVAQGGTTPQNDVRTIDKTGEDAPVAEYPPIPPLPSPEDDSQTLSCPPPALPARPISPMPFPLFCSPGDLWIDRPGDQQRGGGSEPYPSMFSNDMSAMSLQAAPHSAEPFTKHSSIETTTALASPYTRRSPVVSGPHSQNAIVEFTLMLAEQETSAPARARRSTPEDLIAAAFGAHPN